MEHNEQTLAKKLMKIGFHASMKGFKYVMDAAEKIYKENYTLPNGVVALYVDIAQANRTKHARVERCIRHLIDTYYNNSIDYPEELVPDADTGKLTNKEFLVRLSRYLYSA